MAIYLNDASKVIRQVATAMQKPSRKWHLQFTRKRSGRRYDPMEGLARQLRKDQIRADMRRAVDKYGKLEAALSEVGKKWKLSRAQLLRIYRKGG